MAAGIHDITIEQGASWRLVLNWKGDDGYVVPLNGWQARMQVRETYASKTPLLDLTTENGRITLDAANGVIAIEIPAAETAAVPINHTKATWVDGKQAQQLVYDLEMIAPSGQVTRLLQGAVLFTPEVTR